MVDANLSNGTCYFAQQSITDGDFIPCGNIAVGNWPCCKIGDVCLGFGSANACYDYDSGNSYVAGCTDATYGDSTCPRKLGFGDQEWVAIHHCATDASGDTEWGGCKNTPANETKLTVLPLSMCDPYCESTTLFVGGSTIAAYACHDDVMKLRLTDRTLFLKTVPTASGGSITWTNGFNPTATSRAPGVPAATTTKSSALATSTPTPPPESDGGLSTGAKIGIGVGSAVLGLLTLAVALLLVRRRRKKTQQAHNPQQPAFVEVPPYAVGGGHDAQKQQPFTGQSAVLNNPDMSYAGVHFKHELPADGHSQTAVSPGLSTVSPDQMSVSNASTLMPGHAGHGGYVSPQSTGTNNYAAYNGQGQSGTVSELQG